MEILIICDQKDCTYNKEDYFVHYGTQKVCTLARPTLCNQGIKKLCLSKTVSRRLNSPCAKCEEQDIDMCVTCCHKNYGNKFI